MEPWEPGDLGVPVIDGPNGCRLALIICHGSRAPTPSAARSHAHPRGATERSLFSKRLNVCRRPTLRRAPADGMFPEMARECAYKGAEVMLRM